MASFAERMGHRAARTIVQSDELDEDTRTELWNVLVRLQSLLGDVATDTYGQDDTENNVLGAVWTWDFKMARDEWRNDAQVWNLIKGQVQQGEWFDALDLIESIVKYLDQYETPATEGHWSALAEAFNNRFETYLVGFRFIGKEITPVDSTVEAEAISAAQEDVGGIPGARHALERATELLADRQNPDYANSIKESISSVEAVVKKITGEGKLGAGLGKLEAAGLTVHPALRQAWSKMYGWTSDEDGIRHGGVDAATADQALAKYMLVTCSAFVSYLIEAGRKTALI